MPDIRLTAETVEYEDTGGEGPVVVLLHGLVPPPRSASLAREVPPSPPSGAR